LYIQAIVTSIKFIWISEPGCSEDESDSYEIPEKVKKLPKKRVQAGKNKKVGEKPVKSLDPIKLRKETMHYQSSDVQSNLRNKMKVIKHEGGEEPSWKF
jgi:hypothetical protein